jgi:hypothetical protein
MNGIRCERKRSLCNVERHGEMEVTQENHLYSVGVLLCSDSNQAPPEYQSKALLLEASCSL